MAPSCSSLMPSWNPGLLRSWVPCWTMRLYFLAASTTFLPSKMLCVIGFSTYTSLPAWQAQIVASECQWFGVASEMASMLLSSRTRRMSCSTFGAG